MAKLLFSYYFFPFMHSFSIFGWIAMNAEHFFVVRIAWIWLCDKWKDRMNFVYGNLIAHMERQKNKCAQPLAGSFANSVAILNIVQTKDSNCCRKPAWLWTKFEMTRFVHALFAYDRFAHIAEMARRLWEMMAAVIDAREQDERNGNEECCGRTRNANETALNLSNCQ